MQRLFNIDKWQCVPDGTAINFGNAEARRVKIDVNSPSPVQLFYADGNGVVTFLANVMGRDVIEFGAYGEFSINVAGGDLWFHTVDGEDYSFAIPDAVILTKLVERRARNPELERIEYMMRLNIERRMDQQRDELEQLWSKRETAAAAAAALAAAAGSVQGGASKPEPAGGAASGAGEAQPADSGSAAAKAD